MLVHLPVYRPPNCTARYVQRLLAQQLVSLHSYFAAGNDADLLVTTNDQEMANVVRRFRQACDVSFELRCVSPRELRRACRVSEAFLQDDVGVKIVLSKFYPIVGRFDSQIVHIDFDTLFLKRVSFSLLDRGDITLINANDFLEGDPWRLDARNAAFLEMAPVEHAATKWLNAGVFSVQRAGFDICHEQVLARYSRWFDAAAPGLDELRIAPEEYVFNALALACPQAVVVLEDVRYHQLTYFLPQVPSWPSSARLLHFHTLKPHMCRLSDGGIDLAFSLAPRLPNDRALPALEPAILALPSREFVAAAILWYQHLHAVAAKLPGVFENLSSCAPQALCRRYLQDLIGVSHYEELGPDDPEPTRLTSLDLRSVAPETSSVSLGLSA